MKITKAALAVLLLATAAWADDSSCPAHQVAEQGYGAFDNFHHVMAPAWHDAWPAKDYNALLKAGAEFETAYAGIEGMEVVVGWPHQARNFKEKRKILHQHVTTYAAAARAGDKDKVYELMPDLHDAFEETAATLLYLPCKGLEAVYHTVSTGYVKHLRAENVDGMKGCAETLGFQVQALTPENLPTELAAKKAEIEPQLEEIRKLVHQSIDSCERENWGEYAEICKTLLAKINAFAEIFL